ncbi:hypothetical protein TKK_0015634 [Trichogramma kaykai]
MEKLSGKHENSTKYIYDGYLYYLDARNSGTIFRCATRKNTDCNAVIYVNSTHNLENQPVFLKNEHCHPRDSYLSLREKFERELKEPACSPDEEDLKDIYDRVKLKPEKK